MEKYLLTEEQKRLWLEWKKNPQSHAYNTAVQFKITGTLNIERFCISLEESVKYFDTFRSYFVEENSEIYQTLSQDKISIQYIDLANISEKEPEAKRILRTQITTPFDLKIFPLVKFILIKAEDQIYYFGFFIPHILSDGGSASKLLKFIASNYNGDKTEIELFWQNQSSLEQYHDIANITNETNNTKETHEFWANYLKDNNLSFNFHSNSIGNKKIDGERVHFQIGKQEYLELKKLAYRYKTTLFSVFLGIFNTLLYRYYGSNDIITAYPVNVRQAELKNFFGFFVNNTVIRLGIDGTKSAEYLIKQIDIQRKYTRDHISYPFNRVISHLRREGQSLGANIMNVYVAQTNLQLENFKLHDLETTYVPVEFSHINNDLTLLYGSECQGDYFDMAIEYRFNIFNHPKIESLIHAFQNSITEILRNSGKSIDSLNITPEAAKTEILKQNSNADFFAEDKSIFSLFLEQAMSYPDAIAIICENERITYAELNLEVKKIVSVLSEEDIKAGDSICVYMERSPQMVATLLAILKMGAAYIPLDINYPEKRVSDIYQDSECRFIATTTNLINKLPGGCHAVGVDRYIDQFSDSEPIDVDPKQPAYIIYTSGSTGKPKGVVVSHKNVIARLFWLQNMLNLTQENTLLAHFNICFDASIYDIFTPLCFGSTVMLMSHAESKDPREIKKIISKHNVTNMISVPSLLNVFLDQLQPHETLNMNNILVGGEKFMPQLRDKFFKHFNADATKLFNVYGPTEGTIIATYFECKHDEYFTSSIPIGKPLANTEIYILNDSLQLQPKGAMGEIYIGGEGVASGYLNNEILTNKCFIKNPFKENGRLYKTGDIGRYLDDWNIEFLSRKDHQVKVRGFRIEIGEIENAILQTSLVSQVAVLLSDDSKLVAYYKPHKEIGALDIKASLSKKLPEYMIPSYFIALDEIPINSSGKLDIGKLPKPESASNFQKRTIIVPRNSTDILVRDIWSEILQTPSCEISITDKFFDIGGDSLMAVGLSLRIEERLGIEFTVNNVFELFTIESCSNFIISQNQTKRISIDNINMKKKAAHQHRKQKYQESIQLTA